ncbi:MAG: hypothetical protein PHQ40_04975 [Anaerolineaceae bacterium]|nr:hypothetical protein [Anaerolineaceae bacterium]
MPKRQLHLRHRRSGGFLLQRLQCRGVCSLASSGAVTLPVPSSGLTYVRRTLLHFAGGGTTDPHFKDETYEYDAWGNQSTTTVYTGEGTEYSLATAGAQTTTTTYDSIYRVRPVTIQPPLGSSFTTTLAYTGSGDYCGLPTSETAPNGLTTTADYDSNCRVSWLNKPNFTGEHTLSVWYDDWQPTNHPHNVTVTEKVMDGKTATTINFSDGMGRSIETITRGVTINGEDAQALLSISSYDAYGRTPRVLAEPFVIGDTSSYDTAHTLSDGNSVHSTFDLLGRVISTRNPDGAATTTSYEVVSNNGENVLQTTTTDARTKITVTLTNAFGQVTKVTPPGGNPAISYEYYPTGNLYKVKQPKDGTSTWDTVLFYDLAGRKTSMDDPDMGHWSYTYDALGNVLTQVDAANNATCLFYDVGNRLKGKVWRAAGQGACPESDPGSYVIAYDYDAYWHNGQQLTYVDEDGVTQSPSSSAVKGLRTAMWDASGKTIWLYDSYGRVTREVRELTNGLGTFEIAHSYYTHSDLVNSTTYPTGEEVFYEYDNRQLPTGMYVFTAPGVKKYIAGGSGATGTPVQYDQTGRMTSNTLGNGLPVTYTYNPISQANAGGLLAAIQAGQPGALLLDLAYTYHADGNIHTIRDILSGVVQTSTFTYDGANRLLTAVTAGGPIPGFSLSYAFNPTTGWLESRTDQLTGITTAFTKDFQHPNAVGEVAFSTGGQTTQTDGFTYDANGNMLIRNEGGILYTHEWTKDNRLKRVTWESGGSNTVTFVYDGDGNRILRIEKNQQGTQFSEFTTIYIGGIYENKVNSAYRNQTQYFSGLTY